MEYSKGRQWAFNNLAGQANGHYVICEVLRLLYDELYTLPDGDKKKRTLGLLLDAFIMSRKISDRLLYYRAKYKDKTGHRGRGIKRIPGSHERRKMRQERLLHDKNNYLLH